MELLTEPIENKIIIWLNMTNANSSNYTHSGKAQDYVHN